MELTNVRVVAEGLAFPEGPVALPDGSLVVVEMIAGRVTRVWPGGRKHTIADVGGGPNGAATGPDGVLYVCNNGGIPNRQTACIQRVALSGKVEVLYRRCGDTDLVAPNDLVFDDTGHFWFTDFGADAIYYAAADGSSIVKVITECEGPNGIGLAPDGHTVYWAQTHTRQVMLRRLSAPGCVVPSPGYSIKALFMRHGLDPDTLLAGLGGARELDSLAIDSAGAVCVGTLIDSGITVISADGRSAELFKLPPDLTDRIVTNICFGGQDLRTAFITCSETGRLVACDWPRAGLKLAFSDVVA
jgi:gluconolactonase